MSNPDILDRIDDVIAWDGDSEDAMVWTADQLSDSTYRNPEWENVANLLRRGCVFFAAQEWPS
jgi:hypothetical protein